MPRPNVLVICVDQWPGRLLGAAGHPSVQTPALDQLARNGVRFTNAYSTTPSCIPARRELYTGAFSRSHGDRVFNSKLEMSSHLPAMARVFREAGYQAYAVGKMHVYPQRDRVGFDDVLLMEEGRHMFGGKADDFEIFLSEQGYTGQEMAHAMCNNEYAARPWHLPEYCHPTNWTAREMCKIIKRRDPKRPSLWYCSFNHPHPPLAPLGCYLDIYRRAGVDMPFCGEWARDFDGLPAALKNIRGRDAFRLGETEIRMAREAFYALCTHVDHQLRLIFGMLSEEGLMENTAVLFTCDHGDMLGNHGLWAKTVFYEESAKIPMILMPPGDYRAAGHHVTDDRLAALADVAPTLLEICGIPAPRTVEGLSLVGDRRREMLYGEHWEDENASRMMHDGRHKLIYYPAGNVTQLFDLARDPDELRNVADAAEYADTRKRLTGELVSRLYGSDVGWLRNGELVGTPAPAWAPKPNRSWTGQRGWRFV